MKSIAFSLALMSWRALAGDGNSPAAPTGVYVEFEHPSRGGLSSTLQNEVESILSPLGFDVQWRDAEVAGSEAWADLALVKFQGHCDLDGGPYPDFVPGPLGWTHVSDGRIQPFAGIDCDRIGALVQSQLTFVPTRHREYVFQRAIARVVAHELYHILAETGAHQGTGVGKAEFTALDLLSGKFHFHPAQARALRDSSARATLQVSTSGR